MSIFVTYCMGIWTGALLALLPFFLFLKRKGRLEKVVAAFRGE